jgi:hypothetical protein
VINAAKDQSINNPSVGGKPRIEFADNRKIVTDNVMTNEDIGILK